MNANETSYPESLSAWLAFLEARRPEHQMALGLERADRVACKLLPASFFNEQREIQVITVGGTNGKGSTVATLSALLKAAGIRFGAWTSPHIQLFNERIRIDGEMVADELISDSFARIEQQRGDDYLSYFEFGALAALDIFVREAVEVIVLEVGLGGRLDAVNIVDADVSIVTTVDLDHQAWLGDTIEKIAYEKAGIFRSGRPAICGEYQPASSLTGYIAEIGALELRRGQAFELDESHLAENVMAFHCDQANGDKRTISNLPVPNLPLTSVACALEAFLWLYPETADSVIHTGMENSRLEGRCQTVTARNAAGEEVTVLLDVAHNPQAARYLADKLQSLSEPVAVLGMLNDKDLEGVLQPLAGLFKHWHVATVDFPARARDGVELQQALSDMGEQVAGYGSVAEALHSAVDQASAGQTVVVFGSFHTVGEALAALS
ncbi:bifunctional folylpolyglutamate synthase/dihydrofolate synthase [Parendozoicomonas haliclonae]|uniref:Dihydrofolate synthase/folylpolyglutamate synthase n=1 Tax=Parendozoicomonas haliclonae TaxID=1960125 RepID=A0A1X7AK50_9GAMM|nr:folylpolyglutamate synthase/dihydrofolate synthase family protein [Parendozoicomonas haliclonae]SMA47491.1 Bifunctional protein FolC [Parendozoicomonas haliclonae]